MTTTTTPEVRYIRHAEQIWVLDSYVRWNLEYMHWDNELKMYHSCPAHNFDQHCPDDEKDGPGRYVSARYFFRAIDETGTEQVYCAGKMLRDLVRAAGDYRVIVVGKEPYRYVLLDDFPAPGPIPKPTLDIERAIAGLNVDYEVAKKEAAS